MSESGRNTEWKAKLREKGWVGCMGEKGSAIHAGVCGRKI